MSSTISPETLREYWSRHKRQREDDLSSDSDYEEGQVDSLLKASVQLSISAKKLSDFAKMLSNSGDNSSNTLPESLLKKAARAYLVHTLQSQEQPSPMSKSILSNAFDVKTFDIKVFQDMIRRPLTANDIRNVMLAIGVNVEDEAQLVVAAMDLISFTGKIMSRTADILQKIEANPPT